MYESRVFYVLPAVNDPIVSPSLPKRGIVPATEKKRGGVYPYRHSTYNGPNAVSPKRSLTLTSVVAVSLYTAGTLHGPFGGAGIHSIRKKYICVD